MGGVMIDGCGTADSYYILKPVGEYYCSYCKKNQQFALEELKRKIRVFFVPTVPLYSKYAVVCTKCKIGHYVDESVKNDILSGKSVVVDIGSDGPVIQSCQGNNQTPLNTEPVLSNNIDIEDAQTQNQHIGEQFYNYIFSVNNASAKEQFAQTDSNNSGVSQDKKELIKSFTTEINNILISKSNDTSQNDSIVQEAPSEFDCFRIKTCPNCLKTFEGEKRFCNYCGTELI